MVKLNKINQDNFNKLYEDNKLFIKPEREEEEESTPSLICSLGIINGN